MANPPSSPSNELKIDAHQVTIEALFGDFYAVPDFQREYVWQPENVEQLLEDIFEELYSDDGKPLTNTEYFIGSIVVYPGADGVYQLIDGQQRTTTIFLILCALRDRLPALEPLRKLIRESRMNDETFEEESLYRVTLMYPDSAGALELVGQGKAVELEALPDSVSVRNLRAASQAANEFLTEHLGDGEARWRQFFALFTKKVKLIRVVTPSQAGALRVFETINNTGVGLTPMDLLKNLLFRMVKPGDFDRVKKGWKDLSDEIEGAKETNPLRFLRYFVLSRFDTKTPKPLPEEELYNWISKNAESAGLETQPLRFLQQLVSDAKIYRHLSRAKDTRGDENRYLQNIQILSGRAKQHFILLLAGQHLQQQLFDRLSQVLENLLFCFIVTREATKAFEAVFYKAAGSLRILGADDAAGLEAFINQWLQPEIDSRAEKLEFALETMRLGSLQKYRLRYLLAKLTQHLDEQAWGSSISTDLSRYLAKSVHVEHILPETKTTELVASFDKPGEYDAYAARLGNLTLLEQSINSVVGQDVLAHKQPEYQKSNFLLTKTIGAPFSLGTNTRPNRALSGLKSWTMWNSQSIEERQTMLGDLAWEVWGVKKSRTKGLPQ